MTAAPDWWQRLPKPAAVVLATASPTRVYHVAALRREERRLTLLLPSLPAGAQDHVTKAIMELRQAADELVAELEQE